MEQKEMAKMRLIIYVLMAYGLTYLMGILMWYGSTKGYDLTVFPTAQMMYPAAGVIVLGVVWGLWHIPDDLFYYTQTSGIPIISGTLSADVMENQNVSWRDLPVAVVLNGLCFGFFLLAMIPGFFVSSASLALQGEKTFHLSANVFKVIIKKENISLELREFVEDSATCLFIAMVGSVVDSVLFLLLYFHFFNI